MKSFIRGGIIAVCTSQSPDSLLIDGSNRGNLFELLFALKDKHSCYY